MELILNFGLAWLSVILVILTAIIYVLRVALRRSERFKPAFQQVNRFLRKHHKLIGLILILTGLVHGLYSSEPVWSLNLGTVCWVLSILLGLNWLLKKQLKAWKGWMFYHRWLTIAFLAVLVLHLVDTGIQAPGIVLDSMKPAETVSLSISDNLADSNEKIFEGATLLDGTYQGEATGYRPGLKVEIIVSGNAITGITVLEHHEVSSRYYTRPLQEIPADIIENQSLDVDLIAGATRTSVGVVNAVNDALNQAVTSGEIAPVETMPSESEHRSGTGKGGGRNRR